MYTLKKSLGQHFLTNTIYIHKIVDHLQQLHYDRLLEVGPGGGALTSELIKIGGKDFKAVELDEEKITYLQKNFPSLSGKIISASFLAIERPFDEPFVVIGNFPYNISTQILFKILDWKDYVPHVIGMFQKEVAQRAAATPGSKAYGVLSALIQPYYDIEYLFDVPPEAFNPPPKVVSGVIRLTRKTEQLMVASEKKYITLVKTAFNQRRKTLRNSVKPLFSHDKLKEDIFNKRPEQLSIHDFALLTYEMQ